MDETRRDFAQLVEVLVNHPQSIWTPAELAALCLREGLLAADLGDGTPRSLATRLGLVAGRYVNERFELTDDRVATFHRTKDRKTNIYRVSVA